MGVGGSAGLWRNFGNLGSGEMRSIFVEWLKKNRCIILKKIGIHSIIQSKLECFSSSGLAKVPTVIGLIACEYDGDHTPVLIPLNEVSKLTTLPMIVN